MSWTILIPTLGQRWELFGRLLDRLMPQVDAAEGAVKVLAYWNNGERRLPDIREALVRAVDTEHMSFIDDDDLVEPDFVPVILQALATGPDYVGFNVQCYTDGEPQGVAYHSLRYRRWSEDPGLGKLYRDISHINPIRTSIARRADFRRVAPGRAEDRAWVRQLRGKLKTEVVIDRVMYHYLWSPAVTAWKDPQTSITSGPWEPLRPPSPLFSYHPECHARLADHRAGPVPPGEHPPPTHRVGRDQGVGRR